MDVHNKKILVIEDEFITAADLIGILERMGFIVPGSTDSGEKVLDLAVKHSPDLILMDINLKGEMNGIEAAEEVQKKMNIPIIFLTGQSDEATIMKAIESEPYGYIIKPFEERILKTTISMALYKHYMDMKMKASEERYRMISESSDDIILIVNPDSTIDYINSAGARIFERTPVELTGKNLSDLFSLPVYNEISGHIKSFTEGSGFWRGNIAIPIENREIWLDLSVILLSGSSPVPDQVLIVGRDITLWVHTRREMEKEGINRIEKNMEQFQILNDQIRNPLTVILSYTSMNESPHSDKIIEAVQRIDNLVTQLDRGWIESEKVHAFLLRHYQHGKKI